MSVLTRLPQSGRLSSMRHVAFVLLTLISFIHAAPRRLRTSVIFPVTAAAAAIAGLMTWVRAPGPWRPSKLRGEVDAQRRPGCTVSPFEPTHIEQPESRHSNPAS